MLFPSSFPHIHHRILKKRIHLERVVVNKKGRRYYDYIIYWH